MCRVRDHLHEQKNHNPNRILERSIYSGYYCFAKTGHKHGFMTDIEWAIHNRWFEFLITNKCLPPHGFIYLRATPEVAYERIKKRARSAEKDLSFEYLQHIHDSHEDFLIHKKGITPTTKQVPILTLDCNQDFESDSIQLQKHFAAIEKFLIETQALQQARTSHNIISNNP
jgi:deoxyadenosine/deoxycytidine kinase